MPMGFIFWLLMLLWGLFGIWHAWPFNSAAPFGGLLLFLVIGLLGWQVFGNPIR